jgi:hypothetical protein
MFYLLKKCCVGDKMVREPGIKAGKQKAPGFLQGAFVGLRR